MGRLSNDQIRGIVTDVRESVGNGDEREQNRRLATTFSKLFESHKIGITDLSILNLFEQVCDPNREVDRQSTQSVTEAITASAFPVLFNKLINPNVWDAYEYGLGDVMSLVTEIDGQNIRKERIPAFTGLDSFEVVQEHNPYPEDTVEERYATIATTKIGKIVSLTLEFLMGDQTASIARKASDVGRKSGETIALYLTQKITGSACTLTGEGATVNLTINGTAYTQFSTDHSTLDQTNANTDSTAFSTAGVTALRTLLREMVDPRGEKIMIVPKVLIVPAELWQAATQLVGSDAQYDTANRAMNAYRNALRVVELVHLTSAGYYYLGDAAAQTYMIWDWKPKLESQSSTSDAAFERDVVLRNKFSARFGAGLIDYRFLARGGS